MDKMGKKRIKQILSWCCIAALVLILAVMPLIAAEKARSDGPVAVVKSVQAATGTVSQALRGGGTLDFEEAQDITIPTGVKLTSFLVKNGDSVKQGDALASVDKVSVMATITQIQDTLEYLDQKINSDNGDSGTTRIQAQTAGVVKQVYAREGDSVQDVMLQYGALAVLSLDGNMAVDLETEEELRLGDCLNVTLATGETVEGRVESRLGNTFIITVEDEGYPVDLEVEITDGDGIRLGSGKLYIHNPWKATAAYGTVSKVNVKENDSVNKNRTLLTLSDTDTAAQQQILLGQRQDYEETMAELFQIYQSGTLTAPCDGVVDGVDEDSAYLLSGEEGQWTVMLLSNVSGLAAPGEGDNGTGDTDTENPNPGDSDPAPSQPPASATTYTGVVALVSSGENGLMLLSNGVSVTISDPGLLSPDVAGLTAPYSYAGDFHLYTIGEDGSLVDSGTVAAAGTLVFVTDGKLIALGSAGGGAQGGQMGDFSGMMPEGMMGSISGFSGFSGYTGGVTTPAFEPYDLTEATVLTVTPEDIMTLEVAIDELDISKVTVGMAAKITVTAMGSEEYPATVTQIGTAENSGGNSKFSVTLTMDRQGQMLPGMSASAKLPLGEDQTGLTIPTAALWEEGSKTFVYTTYDQKEETLGGPVEVTVGVADGETVTILDGLAEGQTVYYNYYE